MSISIVTACMDREVNFQEAVINWVNLNVSEIIIIDWSSKLDIREQINKLVCNDKRVKVIRVEGKKRWVLTHAYNLGFKFARSEFILKLDCDHILEKNKFQQIKLMENCLYRFNHFTSNSGINGAFLICSKLLRTVNYFDERIVTYGFDETDLFRRASEHAKCVFQLDDGMVTHLEHTAGSRTINQSINLETSIAKSLGINTHEFMTICNECESASRPPWGQHNQSMWAVQRSDTDFQFDEITTNDDANDINDLRVVVLSLAISKAYQILNRKNLHRLTKSKIL